VVTPSAGRRKKRILALGIALGASLLLAEIAVRVRVGTPLAERMPILMVRANPHRGWEMVPGEHYTYQHLVRVNSLGLRGPELAAKEANERRILFLGDSLTYGQGVADDETVPVALERALQEREPRHRWNVVNGGCRAYGTESEIGLLEELGERIQPDVVLLGWYWNDVSERTIQETYETFLPRGEFAFDTGGSVEGWGWLRWHALQLPRHSALVMLVHDLFSGKNQVFAPEVVEDGFQRLPPLLGRMRAECARLGATAVMLIFPDANRLAGAERTRPIDERAAALARQDELPLIELLPALQPLYDASGRLPILAFDGHYDAAANRAMGAYLAGRLLALGVPERAE
jgi:lysophospholipase L1-like esterase